MKTPKYAVLVACLALAATGCGSSDDATDASAQDGSGAAGGPGQEGMGQGMGQGGMGQGGPGGSGKVAAVSGTTAQVQGQSGQVAVTWTAKTAFSRQVATTASALQVGDCVFAMPARTAASSGSGSSGSSVDAASVRITAAVDGSCTGGLPAGPSGADLGNPPSGMPSGGPSGAPGRGGRPGGFGAVGEVTAISGSGFTVASAQPASSGSSDAAAPVEVTTTGDTTWTTSKKATAAAVVVGQCVSSTGPADATGAIAADSIVVSAPEDGECTNGMGGFGPGAGAPGADQGADQSENS